MRIAVAIELLGYSLRTAGIEVRADLDRTVPAIWADPDQISQVLINLIVNAQQALAESLGQRTLAVATGVNPRDGMIRTFIEETGLPFLEKPFMPAEVRRLAAETAARRSRATHEPAAS